MVPGEPELTAGTACACDPTTAINAERRTSVTRSFLRLFDICCLLHFHSWWLRKKTPFPLARTEEPNEDTVDDAGDLNAL